MTPTYTIRHATPADGATINAYLIEMFAEPDIWMITEPEEYQYTDQEQADFIENLPENSCVFVAMQGDDLLGTVACMGGKQIANTHEAILSITVHQNSRGQGIGKALMQAAIAWGREHPTVKRLQLHVYAQNDRAIALYEKMGFVREGLRRKALLRFGEYQDEIIMAILLD